MPARFFVVAVLLMVSAAVLGSVLPGGLAQTQQLRISNLWADAPIVSDGTNQIQGTVTNGATPASVWVTVVADGEQSYGTTHFLGPGESEQITDTWPAENLFPGTSQVSITMRAVVRFDDAEMPNTEVQRTIQPQPQVQWNDVRVTADAANPLPSQMEADETVRLGLLVKNHGNRADEAALSLADVPSGWAFEVSPASVQLAAGASAPVTVLVTSPESAVATDRATATLEVRTTHDRVDRVLSSFEVDSPPVVEGDSLRVDVDPPVATLAPGDPSASFTVRVFNPTSGTLPAEVSLVSSGSTSGVTVDPSGSLADENLAPGEDLEVQVDASVAADALAGPRVWNVMLNGATAADLTVDVQQVFGVGVWVDAAGLPTTAEPGQAVDVPLLVSNLGNGPDVVCLSAVAVPAGWQDPQDCLALDPAASTVSQDSSAWNQTVSHVWSLVLETSAPAGSKTVGLQGVSAVDASIVSGVHEFVFDVPERTHPRLVPPVGPFRPMLLGPPAPSLASGPDADPDEPELPIGSDGCTFPVGDDDVLIPLRLLNQGNADGDFDVSASVTSSEPPGGWQVAIEPDTAIAVAEGADGSADAVVSSPADMLPDDWVEFDVRIQDAEDPSRSDVRACRAEAAFAELTIMPAEPLQAPATLYAGHPAQVRVHIVNAGWAATEDPVVVRSRVQGPDGFDVEQDHTVEPLGAYPSSWFRTLEVGFTPEVDGEYTYEIEVDPEDAIAEPAAASHELAGALSVSDFGVGVNPAPARHVIPSQDVAFEASTDTEFEVVNDGPDTHTLTISVALDRPWKDFPNRTVTLGPGESETVEVSFRVPEIPQAPGVNVTVRAANATLGTLWREATTYVTIDDDEPPVITDFQANVTSVLVGDSADFTAEITDGAGILEARLYVIAPDGTSSFKVMDGDGPVGTFVANASFDVVGDHRVHVWARDAAESPNDRDNLDEAIVVEALTDDRPHVRLVTPDNGSILRPGQPVVLTVLSRIPIVETSYRLGDNASTSLVPSNPLQVPTDDWSDGAVQVNVSARDAHGTPAWGVYSFLVDGTSPTVRNLTISATEPGANATVGALVEDAGGIASVVVRVAQADGTSQESALEAASSGGWSAEVVVPADLVSVTVIATDQAGNTGFAEQEFEVAQALEAPDEGILGIPGPGIVSLLILMAALVVLRSRRDGGP